MITPPKIRIAHLPTPVEAIPRLTALLNGPTLYVKRDDLTGLAFGGNKTRKLELLMADAQAQGARTLLTTGAVQSNHCRQTAAAAARLGFGCILVLAGEAPDRPTGNVLLDYLFGAEVVWVETSERDRALKSAYSKALAESSRSPPRPVGTSRHATRSGSGRRPWRTLMHAYAQLTTSVVVFCNRVGVDESISFWGGSEIIAPSGETVLAAPLYDEGLFTADVALEDIRRERIALPLLRDERPELLARELERLIAERAELGTVEAATEAGS